MTIDEIHRMDVRQVAVDAERHWWVTRLTLIAAQLDAQARRTSADEVRKLIAERTEIRTKGHP